MARQVVKPATASQQLADLGDALALLLFREFSR
jgi:hypothetical protein